MHLHGRMSGLQLSQSVRGSCVRDKVQLSCFDTMGPRYSVVSAQAEDHPQFSAGLSEIKLFKKGWTRSRCTAAREAHLMFFSCGSKRFKSNKEIACLQFGALCTK